MSTAVSVEIPSISTRYAVECVIKDRINIIIRVIGRITRKAVDGIEWRKEKCRCRSKEKDKSSKKIVYAGHGYQIGTGHTRKRHEKFAFSDFRLSLVLGTEAKSNPKRFVACNEP